VRSIFFVGFSQDANTPVADIAYKLIDESKRRPDPGK
jgi:hypothetical protein